MSESKCLNRGEEVAIHNNSKQEENLEPHRQFAKPTDAIGLLLGCIRIPCLLLLAQPRPCPDLSHYPCDQILCSAPSAPQEESYASITCYKLLHCHDPSRSHDECSKHALVQSAKLPKTSAARSNLPSADTPMCCHTRGTAPPQALRVLSLANSVQQQVSLNTTMDR